MLSRDMEIYIYIYILYKIIKTLDLLEMKSILCGINGKLHYRRKVNLKNSTAVETTQNETQRD